MLKEAIWLSRRHRHLKTAAIPWSLIGKIGLGGAAGGVGLWAMSGGGEDSPESAPEATTPATTPPPAPEEQRSLTPLLLAIPGAAALGLGGYHLLKARKKKKEEEEARLARYRMPERADDNAYYNH